MAKDHMIVYVVYASRGGTNRAICSFASEREARHFAALLDHEIEEKMRLDTARGDKNIRRTNHPFHFVQREERVIEKIAI